MSKIVVSDSAVARIAEFRVSLLRALGAHDCLGAIAEKPYARKAIMCIARRTRDAVKPAVNDLLSRKDVCRMLVAGDLTIWSCAIVRADLLLAERRLVAVLDKAWHARTARAPTFDEDASVKDASDEDAFVKDASDEDASDEDAFEEIVLRLRVLSAAINCMAPK
jgi:hypothetical protein